MGDPNLRLRLQRPIPQLAVDLVIGHIRWNRALGVPEGDIKKAFVIECYHYEEKQTGDQVNPLISIIKSPHLVDAWEGHHDEGYYRITFMTNAQWPRSFQSTDVRGTQNFLNVSFRKGMIWKNPGPLGADIKTIHPWEIVFNPPGQVQVLPDVQVLDLHSGLFR